MSIPNGCFIGYKSYTFTILFLFIKDQLINDLILNHNLYCCLCYNQGFCKASTKPSAKYHNYYKYVHLFYGHCQLVRWYCLLSNVSY
jgi:hypothetical protein